MVGLLFSLYSGGSPGCHGSAGGREVVDVLLYEVETWIGVYLE